MTEASSAAPYVANVIRPARGACFRMVTDPGREGYPKRCPEPVACRGIVLDPKGRRLLVDSCAGHAPDLTERRPLP